jgi:nucleotide-binding universal stress UspA family protein
MLREYAVELKKRQVACKAVAMRGDARDNIIRKTKELGASVLIMGSRGLGAIKRTLIGSVSDFCVHHCECPVIIVKHESK